MTAEAKISLSALLHNFELCRGRVRAEKKNAKLWCVVKSNAYGHGLIPCANALYGGGARQFCVAKEEEGISLKTHFPQGEVLVLGKTAPRQAEQLANLGIAQAVHGFTYAKALSEALTTPLDIHIKVDIGMGRMGVSVASFAAATSEILAISHLPNIRVVGVFGHLPEADSPNSAKTPAQIEKFHTLVRILRGEGLVFFTHLAATAGLLRFGLAGCDGARVGIGLYGISPSPLVSSPCFRPVLSLRCPLLQVKTLAQGESVGYGGVWEAPTTGKVGIIPFGYADGLPRLCEGGKVFVFGHSVPIVGRISMDYATLWLGNLPAEEGDTVTLYDKKGKNLWALSGKAQTIPYELLSTLSPRITRKYVR